MAAKIYSNFLTGSSATIVAPFSNVAGAGMAPLPSVPVVIADVVIGNAADIVIVTYNGASAELDSISKRVVGFRIDSGTPILGRLFENAENLFSDFSTIYKASDLGLTAGTYDFELVASKDGAVTSTMQHANNYRQAGMTVTVIPGA